MALEKHHKIMIGSFTSLIIIYMITNGIFIYMLFLQVEANNNSLTKQVMENQAETESKIIELTESIKQTREDLGTTISSLNNQIDQLKASASSDFSGIIEEAIPSVVTIRTDVAQGTGFIIDEEGFIVTNAHVLVGGREIYAITSDQEIKEAQFFGYDSDLDIALLKIPGNYPALELANSNNVQVGEKVIAIGNPLGLQFSVSEGIVSAVHRPGANNINAYIQTDAALNPGNSGGPLINTRGQVVGVNNFKIGGSESLGFALESNYIKQVVNEISNEIFSQNIV